jgi:hypothetical protein
MNNDFFDKLYRGYSAESFITGQLFEYGFEAFRLPADFGIDLVVTNQFKKLKSKGIYDNSFPFGFQVKSWRLQESDALKGSQHGIQQRKEYRFYYLISHKEIKALQEFSNSALAFVFIMPFGCSIRNIYAFCIHSREIEKMIQNQFFINCTYKDEKYYKLNVCFRSLSQHNRKAFIDEMVNENLIDKKAADFLEKNLPQNFPSNWNEKEGLYLRRKSYAKNSKDQLVNESIVSNYDFSKFPNFPRIFS